MDDDDDVMEEDDYMDSGHYHFPFLSHVASTCNNKVQASPFYFNPP